METKIIGKNKLLKEIDHVHVKYEDGNYSKDAVAAINEIIWIIEGKNEVILPEKPVVPAFIANFIQHRLLKLGDQTLLEIGSDLYDDLLPPGIDDWIIDNKQKFVQAFEYGYKVEEVEKKYTVKDKEGNILLLKNDKGEVYRPLGNIMYMKKSSWLTEKEIKQFDERFWPFAQEVSND